MCIDAIKPLNLLPESGIGIGSSTLQGKIPVSRERLLLSNFGLTTKPPSYGTFTPSEAT